MAMGYQTDKQMELQDSLLRMMRVASRNHTLIEGTVVDVDTEAYTCTVQIGDSQDTITISDVSLEVLVGSPASVTFLPAIGSACVLTFRDGHQDRPQLLKLDQVDTVIINPKTKVIFNDGENGVPLTPQTVIELNGPENDLNELKNLISTWVPVSGDGGASLKTLLTSWFNSKVNVTKNSDIASTRIFQ